MYLIQNVDENQITSIIDCNFQNTFHFTLNVYHYILCREAVKIKAEKFAVTDRKNVFKGFGAVGVTFT